MSENADTEMRPVMSEAEAAMLSAMLRNASNMIEFGCGGSTLLAARLGVKMLHSVESDRAWYEKVAKHPEISARKNWILLHADIGPTGAWGGPTDLNTIPKWSRYHSDVWDYAIPRNVDFVFVDGRFRVACALQAASRCRPGTVVAMHDYTNRPHYHVVGEFLQPIESTDTMQSFVVPLSMDRARLKETLEAFDVVPA